MRHLPQDEALCIRRVKTAQRLKDAPNRLLERLKAIPDLLIFNDLRKLKCLEIIAVIDAELQAARHQRVRCSCVRAGNTSVLTRPVTARNVTNEHAYVTSENCCERDPDGRCPRRDAGRNAGILCRRRHSRDGADRRAKSRATRERILA